MQHAYAYFGETLNVSTPGGPELPAVHAWLYRHQGHSGLPPRPQWRRRAAVLHPLDWTAIQRCLLGAVCWVARAPGCRVMLAYVWQSIHILASSCAWLLPTQVGATTVRRISKERIYAFHNKHRGALDVQPEVQDSWSEVSSTGRQKAQTLHAPIADRNPVAFEGTASCH
jgi:hypothetical protein